LSKISGIARSRIYDVLRNLNSRGYVLEVDAGLYVPLPPDELIKRLQRNFGYNIEAFEDQIAKSSPKNDFEYVWPIKGYDNVMAKAIEMIRQADKEIYVRLFPKADRHLIQYLIAADKRGVKIRYIAMGKIEKKFDVQVSHPDHEHLLKTIGGRSLEVITDKKEALVGIFEINNEDYSPINWTRNRWFIIANRDSLRHDFYHSFLEKILDQNKELTINEKRIYQIIKEDN
jgi:sugar-specific transcriptional regulator TrmB